MNEKWSAASSFGGSVSFFFYRFEKERLLKREDIQRAQKQSVQALVLSLNA
jgi:hypothetical protein